MWRYHSAHAGQSVIYIVWIAGYGCVTMTVVITIFRSMVILIALKRQIPGCVRMASVRCIITRVGIVERWGSPPTMASLSVGGARGQFHIQIWSPGILLPTLRRAAEFCQLLLGEEVDGRNLDSEALWKIPRD